MSWSDNRGTFADPSFLEAWHMNTRVTHVWDDWSLAKPREECTPFTFELYEPAGYDAARSVKMQEKFIKGLERLTKAQARKDAARAKAEAKRLKAAA